MINKKYPDYHSSVQKYLDYIPLVSIGSAFLHIAKSAFNKKSTQTTITNLKEKKIEYYSKRQLSHAVRAVLCIIPIIGNIAMFIYDKRLKKISSKNNIDDKASFDWNKIEKRVEEDYKVINFDQEMKNINNNIIPLNVKHNLNILNQFQHLSSCKIKLNKLFKQLILLNLDKGQESPIFKDLLT